MCAFRGTMRHSNGFGCLSAQLVYQALDRVRAAKAYETARLLMSSESVLGLPCASSGGLMVNACRIEAQVIIIETSAKWRPGHILCKAM